MPIIPLLLSATLGAASAAEVSTLNVSGNATLTGGTETFSFVNGYTPAAGDRE